MNESNNIHRRARMNTDASTRIVNDEDTRSHGTGLRLSAQREAGRRPSAKMLARAIAEHSSMAKVAAHLGVSKTTVARWCDPDDHFDVTLRDVTRMPEAVAQSIAQQMAAVDDAISVERAEHARTRELYAETLEEAFDLIERKLGIKIERIPTNEPCGGRRGR